RRITSIPLYGNQHDGLRRFLLEGESRKCGLGGQKSRFHQHRTRPPGVNCCGRGREDACSRQITETTPRSSRLGLGTTSKLAPMSGRPPVFFRYFNGHLRVTTMSLLSTLPVEIASERQALAYREPR